MLKNKNFHLKNNIALASILSIFIGSVIGVPLISLSSNKRNEVVFRNVPVFIYTKSNDTENILENNQETMADFDIDENVLLNFPYTDEYEKAIITKYLKLGDNDPEVKSLQKFLNESGFLVAEIGPGSPGNETDFFGLNTKKSLSNFQNINKTTISNLFGEPNTEGFIDDPTMKFINR